MTLVTGSLPAAGKMPFENSRSLAGGAIRQSMIRSPEVSMTFPSVLPPLPAANAATRPAAGPEDAIRQAANALESAFLAEMLKASGLGGIGQGGGDEDPFDSFMAEAKAQALMARGGIGLASHIEQALLMRQQRAAR